METPKKNNKIDRIDNTQGFLALPFDNDQFKEFLIGLSGRPQKIERVIEGNFDISLSDIQNFHYLIEQRINQQNEGRLLQFRAKIGFDDNSSVELNSFEELETYNEIRPVISESVELSWDYLVLFKDKKIPEKQTIEIGIFADNHMPRHVIGSTVRLSAFFEHAFRIVISYTARTWAADIEALLITHIRSILKPENKFRKFLSTHEGTISLTFGALFSASAITVSFLAIKSFISAQLSSVGTLIKNQPDTNGKINILASYIISGGSSEQYFAVIVFLAISLFLAIFLSVWLSSNLIFTKHSFITLTRKAVEYRDKTLKEENRQMGQFIISLIVSIFSGVISNYIFLLLTKPY